MILSNGKQYNPDPILGIPVELLWGTSVPDNASFFTTPQEGSIFYYRNALSPRTYRKVKDEGVANDWIGMGLQAVSQSFSYDDFTDGGSTVGTLALTIGLPARAWAFRSLLSDVTGFTGDTSATITVGDGSDADRYNTGTPSIFTTATVIDLGAVSGTAIHTAATTFTLTVTSDSDFGDVAAGEATLTVFYLLV